MIEVSDYLKNISEDTDSVLIIPISESWNNKVIRYWKSVKNEEEVLFL